MVRLTGRLKAVVTLSNRQGAVSRVVVVVRPRCCVKSTSQPASQSAGRLKNKTETKCAPANTADGIVLTHLINIFKINFIIFKH